MVKERAIETGKSDGSRREEEVVAIVTLTTMSGNVDRPINTAGIEIRDKRDVIVRALIGGR